MGNVHNTDARSDCLCPGHLAVGDTMLTVVATLFRSVVMFLWATYFFIC
jgi:hypothetical protein